MVINSFLLKLSKFISLLFNPLFSLLFFFIYQESKLGSFSNSAMKFFWLLIFIILPISLWIFYRVKSGKYTDSDVSDREQRKTLYFFIITAIGFYLIFNFLIYHRLDYIMIYLLILLILMQISNLIIKNSMHTALNIFVAALFFVENYTLGIIWLFTSIIVGITRILLKRHTLQEVLSGGFIALFISVLYILNN